MCSAHLSQTVCGRGKQRVEHLTNSVGKRTVVLTRPTERCQSFGRVIPSFFTSHHTGWLIKPKGLLPSLLRYAKPVGGVLTRNSVNSN